VQLVHESVREHRADQHAAAADVEIARFVFQPLDRFRVVRSDDLGVPPRRILQRRRHDVLHRVVEERRAGILFDRARRPCRLEHLVGVAPEENALATRRDSAEDALHPRHESIFKGPDRCINHSVEAHEFVDVDGTHSFSSALFERFLNTTQST
jgi:hypothetical protein